MYSYWYGNTQRVDADSLWAFVNLPSSTVGRILAQSNDPSAQSYLGKKVDQIKATIQKNIGLLAGAAPVAGLSLGSVISGIGSVIGGISSIGKYLPTPATGGKCPTGYTEVLGECFANNAGAYVPGGQPATVTPTGVVTTATPKLVSTSAGGTKTVLTSTPTQKTEIVRRCPKGMVLGKDDMCYLKGAIPRGYRKWPYHRPFISRSDVKAIRRADRSKKKVERLGKQVGLHVSKTARRRSSSRSTARFGGVLRPGAGVEVIETN